MTEQTYKAGDLLPDGTIYLGRIDDTVWIVNPKDEDGLFTWDDAMKHVEKMEMELLDNVSAMLMFINCDKGRFKGTFRKDKPYWTSRRYSDTTRTSSGWSAAPRTAAAGRTRWLFALCGDLNHLVI